MNITLIRREARKDGIFGSILDEKNNFLFVTLEHSYEQPDGTFLSKIRKGVHVCKRYFSPKHGYEVFRLAGDDEASHFYEIHVGNYDGDSEGCILIGEQIGPMLNGGWMITASIQSFKKFMDLQKDINSFILTVE